MVSLTSGYILLYGAVVGFAFAGVAACAFEYVTDERLGFDIAPEHGLVDGFSGLLIRILAGPFLVARFLEKVSREGAHPLLVGAGSVLVISWSLSIGILIISSVTVP